MILRDQIYWAGFAALLVIGFFFRKNESNKDTKVVDAVFCVTVALMAGTFLTLFPLTNSYPPNDSSVFIYIGKKMLEGKLPYKDLFDHKGILLYFIQCLGLVMTPGSYHGIWLLEVLHITVASFLLYKIACLFTEDRIVRYVSMIAVFVICGMNIYGGGNYTEEFALPWIAFAVYTFMKYFWDDQYRFTDIMILGVGFAVVLLLRVNMVISWAAVMPIILVRMIIKGQWKESGNCALGFLAGILIVFVPVLGYTFVTGCFWDMIDCYIIFNFAYSESGKNISNMITALGRGTHNIFFAMIALFLSLVPNVKNRLYLLNLYLFVISLYFAHMSGRYDSHYCIILMPMMIPFFTGIITNLYRILSINEKIGWKLCFPNKVVMIAGLAVAVLMSFYVQLKWSNLIEDALFSAGNLQAVQTYLLENTTKEDDVLIVGNDVKRYLMADRQTDNKLFYQTPPIKFSKELSDEFIEEVKRCKSKAIIVMGEKEKHLRREDSLGDAYRFLNELGESGAYECLVFEDYYIYERVEEK